MRLRGWITGGVMAALLLSQSANGSEVFAPSYIFYDDLRSNPGSALFPGPEDLQRLAVTLQIESQFPDPFAFRMIGWADGYVVDEPSDFAVMLVRDGGKSRIVHVQLAFASSLYRDLLQAKAGYFGQPDDPAEQRENMRKLLRETSPQQYLDARNVPGDSTEMRRIKERINRMQSQRRVERCEIEIPEPLANQMQRTFLRTVRRARYGRTFSEERNDSRQFHHPFRFSFAAQDFSAAGEAYTPGHLFRGSRPELIVSASLAMRSYCRTRDAGQLDLLRQAVERLEKRAEDDTNILPQPPAER
jgi:hypothetical protein